MRASLALHRVVFIAALLHGDVFTRYVHVTAEFDINVKSVVATDGWVRHTDHKVDHQIKLIPLQAHGDDRGSLVSLEDVISLFEIKRGILHVQDTKEGFAGVCRKSLRQVAIAVRGSCVCLG